MSSSHEPFYVDDGQQRNSDSKKNETHQTLGTIQITASNQVSSRDPGAYEEPLLPSMLQTPNQDYGNVKAVERTLK